MEMRGRPTLGGHDVSGAGPLTPLWGGGLLQNTPVSVNC